MGEVLGLLTAESPESAITTALNLRYTSVPITIGTGVSLTDLKNALGGSVTNLYRSGLCRLRATSTCKATASTSGGTTLQIGLQMSAIQTLATLATADTLQCILGYGTQITTLTIAKDSIGTFGFFKMFNNAGTLTFNFASGGASGFNSYYLHVMGSSSCASCSGTVILDMWY